MPEGHLYHVEYLLKTRDISASVWAEDSHFATEDAAIARARQLVLDEETTAARILKLVWFLGRTR